MVKPDDRVVIAGAGPAGAMLAYLLARASIPVVLIERQRDFAREFRGEGVSPSGQAVFREAGLWQRFDALPQTRFNQLALYFKGRKIIHSNLGHLPESHSGRFVSQPALLEMLIEEASRFQQFEFIRGGHVVGPLVASGKIAGVRVKIDNSERDVAGAYTFATDGRASPLRRAAGLDHAKRPQGFNVLWCKLPMPKTDASGNSIMRGYFGGGSAALLIPSHDGKLQLGWIIKKDSFRQFRQWEASSLLEHIAACLDPELGEHVRAHKHTVDQLFRLDVVSDCHDRWSVPGMLLLGDAAHPMSPFGSQGINIALRDAVVTANHFVPILRGSYGTDDLAAAAERVYRERIKEVARIQHMQAMAPKFQLSTSSWVGFAVGCIRLFNAAGGIRLAARLAPRFRHPFLHGVTDVTLNV